MILSESGNIYYLVSDDGNCTIKEIKTRNDSEHETIFHIKSNICYAFTTFDNFFYFIDHKKNILKLSFQKDVNTLVKESNLYFKDVDKHNFKYLPFGNTIISDQFVI